MLRLRLRRARKNTIAVFWRNVILAPNMSQNALFSNGLQSSAYPPELQTLKESCLALRTQVKAQEVLLAD